MVALYLREGEMGTLSAVLLHIPEIGCMGGKEKITQAVENTPTWSAWGIGCVEVAKGYNALLKKGTELGEVKNFQVLILGT